MDTHTPPIPRRTTPSEPHLLADGMSVREILEKLAELAAGSPAGPGFDLRLVVDVTNAWSIPCTAQPLELAWHNGLRGRAWVRLQTLRERGERVHAIYRLWT